ncbi:MAG: NAD(P)-dependent oxidoreductase [Deltaproteobacteria bacterium]|nr:NAD(P)-dependent oxidoreductase [Deltaproteobacteria bacterium]
MDNKMEPARIGFIGFGEVGKTFASAMASGGAEVFYYDIVRSDAVPGAAFRPLEELVARCQILLSTVTTHVAVAVAETTAPLLTSRNTYADMNSTSASVKRRIAGIIGPSAANFVEGAILSAVGEAGAKASILVAGEKAEAFARQMNRLGLVNVKYFSSAVGEASQVKMLRSIFSKGVECLLLEMLVAGKRAGVAGYLWKDIVGFMTNHPFQGIAENWIKTHPGASRRRYHEMEQVLETLEELDIDPVMTRGTTEFFRQSVESGLDAHFKGKPDDVWAVPEEIEKRRRAISLRNP